MTRIVERICRVSFIGLLIGAALGVAARADAACGDGPGDAQSIAAVRAAIAAQCDCAGAASRGDYIRCASNVISAAVNGGQLPSVCASSVKRCVSKSTCGRKPGAVTCCRTTSSGRVKCSVKSNASKCRAPSGGSACTGAFASCCDACGASGCAPTHTPTVTATPTITPTPTITATFTATPTIPALCQSMVPLPPIAQVPITIQPGTEVCGGAGLINPAPQPPLSGSVQDGSDAVLGELGLGCMYAGFLPSLKIPDGSVAKVDVVGLTLLPPSIKVTGSAGSGPSDCSKGAGPGSSCANGQPGIDGAGTCNSDVDCDNKFGACLPTANCFFGAPIPVSSGGLAMCVLPAFLTDLCGEVNLAPVEARMSTALSARVYFTANTNSPCPRCLDGVCDSGERAGEACTPVGSAATSSDCPPAYHTFVTALTVVIPELTTGDSVLEASDGLFCDGQTIPGAFGLSSARRVTETGVAPLSGEGPFDVNIAGTFCLPATNTFIDTIAQLPGVGAMTAKASIDVSGLLPLP